MKFLGPTQGLPVVLLFVQVQVLSSSAEVLTTVFASQATVALLFVPLPSSSQ